MYTPWLRNLFVATLVSLPVTCSAFCFQEASKEFNLSENLLHSIAKHESGLKPLIIHWNTNGTYDFGLMGINTIHEPELRRNGIPWNALADPCTNVRVGAWILSKCIAKYGYTWKGVGCYNSQTPSKRNIYANKIYKVLLENHINRATHPVSKAPSITEIASIQAEQTKQEYIIGLDTYQ